MSPVSKKGFCLTGLVGALALSATSPVTAAIFKVDCDQGQTIQHRLDNNTKSGDTVEVKGACDENVIIRQNGIRVEGQDGATITAVDDGTHTVLVVGRNATISGFTISGGRVGVTVSNSGSATIRDNTVSGNRLGVLVTRSSFGFIEDNTISGNGFEADGETTISRGHGIFVGLGSSAEINDNVVDGNGDVGIRVADTGNARISDNTIIRNGGSGLDVTLGANVRLSDGDGGPNIIAGNGADHPTRFGYGIRCRVNASIWFIEVQTDTYAGPPLLTGNTPGNTDLRFNNGTPGTGRGCITSGAPF